VSEMMITARELHGI